MADLEPSLHNGMKAAEILDRSGLCQDDGGSFLGGDDHLKAAISGRGGVIDDIVIGPFDGVADPGHGHGRFDHQILHQDPHRFCMRWPGARAEGERGCDQDKRSGLHDGHPVSPSQQ